MSLFSRNPSTKKDAAPTPLVSFLIAGTQKAGTTSLDGYLRQHPQLGFPQQTKELHFFNTDMYFESGKPQYHVYHRHFEKTPPAKLYGESTPAYTYSAEAPERIWQYNPQMKLIVLLRNPIARAWSHWQMIRRWEKEDLSFSEAIRQEPARLRAHQPTQDLFHSYVDRGFYSEQIRRLDRFFERGQILFIKSETFFNDPQPELRRVFSFLGIDAVSIDTSEALNAAPAPSEMPAEDRTYLEHLYRWEIRQVEALLNWDCADWLNST